MKNEIQYISIDKLYPHPDNPRKDLGDLTELAASIKESGIFQNLTVVPWFDEESRTILADGKMADCYRMVIGHRRLAAAKLAGLEKVPCIISLMDYKTQLSTMLLENMQRSDLTIYEQAEGFQMMLDIGLTVNELSEKTGLSESTVRRRVKLLDLDKEKFKQANDRGATLNDFAELDKIKNPTLKNRVLNYIGTNNFDFELRQAIQEEKSEEYLKKWREYLEQFATETRDPGKYDFVRYINVYSSNPPKDIPEDTEKVKYYFIIERYNSRLLKERSKEAQKNNKEKTDKENERVERHQKLDRLNDTAAELRHSFIRNYTGKNEDIPVLQNYLVKSLGAYNSVDLSDLLEVGGFGLELNEESGEFENSKGEEVETENLIAILENSKFTKVLATYLFAKRPCEQYYDRPYDYENKYKSEKAERIKSLYDFLEKLGYQISDEERKYIDGTHELYIKE